MNRYRVTIEAWTLVDVDVEANSPEQAQDRARAEMPFPPPEGWDSLDFDFKQNNVRDDGPTDVGTAPEDQDLLEAAGLSPWGRWDPSRDPVAQVRYFLEKYGEENEGA